MRTAWFYSAVAVSIFASSAYAVEYIGGIATNNPQWQTVSAMQQDVDNIRNVDAAWMRMVINWDGLQQTKATPVANWDWARYDNVINYARPTASSPRKLNILLILHTVPAWANGGSGDYGPANDIADWKNYCKQVALRYRGRGVNTFQIGNEINLRHPGWASPDAQVYVDRYLKPAYEGISEAFGGSGFTIILGSLANNSWDPQAVAPRSLLVGIYDYVTPRNWRYLFHHASFHPYVDINHVQSQYPNQPGIDPNFVTRTQELRDVMVYFGDSSKQIWATEFGAPTNGSNGGTVSEADLAAWVNHAVPAWYSRSFAGPFFWYTTRDAQPYSGGGTYDRESYFGLLRSDWTQKGGTTSGAFARLKAWFRY